MLLFFVRIEFVRYYYYNNIIFINVHQDAVSLIFLLFAL